jgi:hypothetical protein
MGEVLVDRDEACERPVVRWRRQEAYKRAEVVAPCPALSTAAARDARFQSNAIADVVSMGIPAELDDDTRCLVAEDDRRAHLILPDPAMLVVVDIGTAHAYGPHLYEHLVRFDVRGWAMFDSNAPRRI